MYTRIAMKKPVAKKATASVVKDSRTWLGKNLIDISIPNAIQLKFNTLKKFLDGMFGLPRTKKAYDEFEAFAIKNGIQGDFSHRVIAATAKDLDRLQKRLEKFESDKIEGLKSILDSFDLDMADSIRGAENAALAQLKTVKK